MRRTHIFALVMGLTVLPLLSAEAQGFGKGMGRGSDATIQEQLAPEVREKIADLRLDFLNETVDQRTELNGEVEKMHLLMRDPDVTDKDLLAAHEKVQELKTRLGKQRFEHMLTIRKELPEELRGKGLGLGRRGEMSGGSGHGKRGQGFGGHHMGRGSCGPCGGQAW